MTNNGWTSSRDELLHIELLDWAYDRSGTGHTVPDVSDYLDEHEDVDEAALDAAIGSLSEHGLLEVAVTMGGIRNWSIAPSNAGTAEVRARRDRRQNQAARAVAARDALLDWMYAQKRAGVGSPIPTNVLRDPRGHFEGDPFTEREVDDASAFLADRALVNAAAKGAGGVVLRGDITPSGEVVVEQHGSSLRAWAAAERSGGSQFVTHFNAPVHGQVGIGEQVNQTQTPAGINLEVLQTFLDDIRTAGADLEPVDQTYLFTYVDLVQAESSNPEPDRAMLSGSMDRLKSIAAKVGNAGLTASVGALVTYLVTLL
ncbi:hypothetical protein J2S40_002379 [Nocardioides luteus]|uniref:hypothetical protein n=2 Tax=Nocardioides luteus TaxID=1844 RepID=UPI00285B76C5|nr:hypothetical protein [Nocardioides luteus]MDR7311321.1 hypothetical protein [Nocardioides luteus]